MRSNIPLDSLAQECSQLIEGAQRIAALTGAGISTNAGVPDFRGPQGLYVTRRYDPDTIFDIGYFGQNPKPFFDFARDFVSMEEKLEPTFTHRFLPRLEAQGKLKGVITQNIDSLHRKAGSKNVLEMHGSFLKSFCQDCRREFSYPEMHTKLFQEDVPRCRCGGVIKPDIVFFGENVKCLAESYALARNSDLFFVIGTSCVVYPAAMMPEVVEGSIVVVNKDPVSIRSSRIILQVQEDIDRFFELLQRKIA